MLIKNSLAKYLDKLASSLPFPGGGSADDLVLGVGIALLEMALAYSKDKESAKYRKRLNVLREKAQGLIDADAKIFADYIKLPSSQRKTLPLWHISQKSADLAKQALEISFALDSLVKKSLRSDLQSGREFCAAALKAAVFNLEINSKGLSSNYHKKTKDYKIAAENYRRRIEKERKRRRNGF